jgi:hypothetical protein
MLIIIQTGLCSSGKGILSLRLSRTVKIYFLPRLRKEYGFLHKRDHTYRDTFTVRMIPQASKPTQRTVAHKTLHT